MRIFWAVMLTCLGLCSSVMAQPKVAVVYSNWSNYSFITEFDDKLNELGWAFEKFENIKIADLVSRLDEFNMVITAGVANYENIQDMTPYRDQWLAWLKQGGCLLVTDANYGSVLDSWVCTFGSEYAVSSASCSVLNMPGPVASEMQFKQHPLLTSPNPLDEAIKKRHNYWAHLDKYDDSWTSLVSCRDGESLYLMRPVDSGLIVLTSFFSFKDPSQKPVALALLDNTWSYCTMRQRGLVLNEWDLPALKIPGGETRVSLTNSSGEMQEFDLYLSISPQQGVELEPQHVKVSLEPGETQVVRMPYTVSISGEINFTLHALTADGSELWNLNRKATLLPPLTVTLRRHHIYQPQEEVYADVSVWTDVNEIPEMLGLRYWIQGQNSQTLYKLTDNFMIPVSLKGLNPGQYNLTCELLRDRKICQVVQTPFTIYPPARVGLRDDGITVIDGKPFFPFGFYHVSQCFDLQHKYQCIRDLSAAGFNIIHSRVMDIEEYGPFLDEAEKLGIMVATEFSTPMDETIKRWRNHPAVIAWNPGDEPELYGTTSETMFSRYDEFKQLDPNALVYTTLATPSLYGKYAPGTEVLAPDPYPIPNGPVTYVYDCINSARQAARPYNTTIWAILQCFAWENKRPPTRDEIYAMTYLSLIAGANGVIYYTYGDTTWVAPDHPEQWDATKELVPVIKRLAPALMDGVIAVDENAGEGIYAGYWTYEGATYGIIVNTNEKPAQAEIKTTETDVEIIAGGLVPEVIAGKRTVNLDAMKSVVFCCKN